jgi:hypothetical protein
MLRQPLTRHILAAGGAAVLKQHPRGFLYFANVPTCVPPSDSDSPERARFLELLLHDPEAARRERLKARVEYWRRRMQDLHDRAAALKALLGQSVLEDGAPALDRWNGRIELLVAQADVLEASRRLADVEHAARAAGLRLEPFKLEDSPVPEPLPVETGPRKRGPKLKCQCGTCARCKARENMRRLRAARKAKAARKVRGA